MGNFYANIAVRTDDQDEVINAVQRRHQKAFISPPTEGWIVVYGKEIEDASFSDVGALAEELSVACRSTAVAVVNYDDDLLWIQTWRNGELVDEYNSAPGYFEGSDLPCFGGNTQALSATLEKPAAASVLQEILHERRYPVQIVRHKEFVQILGLPLATVGFGYRYIEKGELPTQFQESDLCRLE